MRTKTLSLVFAAALVLAGAAPVVAAAPAIGSIAPDFSLQTADGKTVTLSRLRGRFVVVNFFATWCPPCRAETPDLISAASAFERRGVAFVGIDVKEPAELVQEFAAAKGISFALALDSDGKVNETYDVRAIPTTYIVGRDGRIAYRQVDQLEGAVLTGALNDVIAGRVPNESPLARRYAATAAATAAQVSALVAQANAARAKGDINTAFVASSQAIGAGVAANKKLDDLQGADGSSSINYFTSALQRDALGVALASAYQLRVTVKPGAITASKDLEQAALLLGQKAEDEERFADAGRYYKRAVELAPKDTKALDGQYLASYELRDYATAAAAAESEARVAPNDPESWLTLASAYNSLKRYDDAIAAEGNALILASVDYALHPKKKHAAYEVGRVFLKMGRSAILADRRADAAAFLASSSALAPGTIVAQQAEEQLAALSPQPVYVAVAGAAKAAAATSQQASLWLLVHNGAARERTVHLAAYNVPKKWVVSFCYEKVCDPFKSDLLLGPSASRKVELRVVPLAPTGGPWKMTLEPGGVDQLNVNVEAKTAKVSIAVLAS